MENEAVRTEEYKGHKIEIFQEMSPDNPRNWDNLTTIHAWHKNIDIGDEECNYNLNEQYEIDRLDNVLKEAKRNRDIILPLYIYQHSGVTIRLIPFSSQWDSGQVGWVIVKRKQILDEWKENILHPALRKKIMKVIEGEIGTYDDYFVGNVYGYVIDDDGDSCWGFFGDDMEELLKEPKAVIDHIVKYEEEKAKLFEWIKKWSKEQHEADLDIITYMLEDELCKDDKNKAVELLEEYREARKEELIEEWRKEFEGKELRDIEKMIVKIRQY